MKVYTKVVIDMDSLDVLEEENFDYEGLIAECKGGGGGTTTKTEYVQSPEQRQIYQKVLPAITQIGQRAAGQIGPLWEPGPAPDVPLAPTMAGALTGVQDPSAAGIFTGVEDPSMAGVLSGYAPYTVPQAVMPSAEWYQGIAPEVRAGIWAPYEEAATAMTGRLESLGQLGAARPGGSAAAGAALGKFTAEAGQQAGLQAWQMTAPQLMQRRQELLERDMLSRQELQRESVADYESAGRMAEFARKERLADYGTLGQRAGFERQERMADIQALAAQQQTGFGLETEGWRQRLAEQQFPYMVLPGLAGGTYSTPVVTQQGGGGGGGVGGAAGGALGGAIAGSALGPWGTAGGALLGGISGAMGGK